MENELSAKSAERFRIFRGGEAPGLEESGVELDRPGGAKPPGEVMEQLADVADIGANNRVLFVGNGMSLIYLWFKSGFRLPPHSHDCDCLYFVVAGTLRMGTETLEAGDGFFVGSDVPYSYTAGNEGVEVLEFRSAEAFYLDLAVKNPAFWTKLVGTIQDKQPEWKAEVRPPSGLALMGD